jgi:hypothetical protein
MAPPYSTKYLYPNYDYENFEFRSPVNPWSPQPKYVADFDKLKCLEFTLVAGKTLFIPAYWWYSIKLNDSNTSISCFRYRTYMNNAAITPYIALYALQIQNVKRNTTKKVNINELNNEVHIINNTHVEKSNENATVIENNMQQISDKRIDLLTEPEPVALHETTINNTELNSIL